MNSSTRFDFVDLFSGIGGFHIALSELGGNSLAFSEINTDAINVYCKNHDVSKEKNLGDITQIKNLPKHDILVAGVPCQSWSIAGKNLGFEDDRGQLWNDTIYLLSQSKPKAFIFENVKGLADPRNRESLNYIMERIKKAGYYAKFFLINSYDFGALQNRVRVFIIGFKQKKYLSKFKVAEPVPNHKRLFEILDNIEIPNEKNGKLIAQDQFGNAIQLSKTRLQKANELNHFFIFSDIRNGHSTIHSWEIFDTTEREKELCLLLLKNRRKRLYGALDGNPLSYNHFKKLDKTIKERELKKLVKKGILKEVDYIFKVNKSKKTTNPKHKILIGLAENGVLRLDRIKSAQILKIKKINVKKTLQELTENQYLECTEKRYEFKFTRISSGILGVNRVYLPTSDVYPTLVASDTNDFVATKNISIKSAESYKREFIETIFKTDSYRKISREEACVLQGFPKDFDLPNSRARWMKLIGNSVSVPVIKSLAESILNTRVFEENQKNSRKKKVTKPIETTV